MLWMESKFRFLFVQVQRLQGYTNLTHQHTLKENTNAVGFEQKNQKFRKNRVQKRLFAIHRLTMLAGIGSTDSWRDTSTRARQREWIGQASGRKADLLSGRSRDTAADLVGRGERHCWWSGNDKCIEIETDLKMWFLHPVYQCVHIIVGIFEALSLPSTACFTDLG